MVTTAWLNGSIRQQMFRRSLLSLASFSITISAMDFNTCSADNEGIPAFSPKEFRSFPIKAIHDLSHNTRAYEIALPSDQHVMGLSVASLIMVQGIGKEGKTIARPYTPTSPSERRGSFELIVKSYPDGNVSSYLGKLNVGDLIEVKGPFSKFKYEPNMKKRIAMLAGGTGITPMLQVIREIVKNPEDKTEVTLLFANHEERDILAKSELDTIADKHPNIKVTYIVSQPSQKWRGVSGRINLELLKKSLPPPSDDTAVYVCGPPGFMNDISGGKTPDFKQGLVSGYLKELGYNEDMVFKF